MLFPHAPLSEQQEKLGLDGISSLQLQQSHCCGAPEGVGSYGKLCQLSGQGTESKNPDQGVEN